MVEINPTGRYDISYPGYANKGLDVPEKYCVWATVMWSSFPAWVVGVLQCFRKLMVWFVPATTSSGMKPAPPSSRGPCNALFAVRRVYPHSEHISGYVYFSIDWSSNGLRNDWPSVYSSDGRMIDSNSILLSFLLTLVWTIRLEICFALESDFTNWVLFCPAGAL